MHKLLTLETANIMLSNAPIVHFNVAGDATGENVDGSVKIYNSDFSAGVTSEYIYETTDYKIFLRIYRFWKRRKGYLVSLDLEKFNQRMISVRPDKLYDLDDDALLSNLKSFFYAAYLDVIRDSKSIESSQETFKLQFVESLTQKVHNPV